MKNQISDTWSDKQKLAEKNRKHEILIKKSRLLSLTVFLIVTEKQQIESDKLKVYQVKNTPKNQLLGQKKLN